ncbi:uncharacterized protein N7500_009306 [Penicillium coprophilum]|uniref:uncharacterized protein n=1 Tax=Penicillium coprophilum TaxID=36646 RepID=UPI00238DAED5|nr:uncharacterized protein N7500_009306 [Penicillium coprophilum]KAJ5153867.1 hypothetical protein N7500_009306 [Penicillium coprophilum]
MSAEHDQSDEANLDEYVGIRHTWLGVAMSSAPNPWTRGTPRPEPSGPKRALNTGYNDRIGDIMLV